MAPIMEYPTATHTALIQARRDGYDACRRYYADSPWRDDSARAHWPGCPYQPDSPVSAAWRAGWNAYWHPMWSERTQEAPHA